MTDDGVDVFGYLHVVYRGVYRKIGEGLYLTAVETAKRNCHGAGRFGVFDRTNNVGRIAATRYADGQIAGTQEIFQLLDEYIVIAMVVGHRGHCGDVVV